MKQENDKKRFNSRAFVSIGTFIFFVCLAVSGIMLQVTDHQPYTFWKVYWKVMHNFAAIAFLIFSLGHISRNWKVLQNYVTKAKNIIISKEMIAGLIILTAIAVECWILSKLLMQHHNIPL
jgi:predicted transporter